MTGDPQHPALTSLVADLASPDPAVRDDGALTRLAQLIGEPGLAAADRRWLGDRMVDRLADPRPWARSFAPLILARLADTWPVGEQSADDWPADWSAALLSWWPAETELRGYDDRVGWIHAVAHGADALAAFGFRRLAPSGDLLRAAGLRLTTATDAVWRDQEEDRVAAAICAVLLGDPAGDLAQLLNPVDALFATGRPGPVPATATNAMRTLRSLYVALGHRVIPPDDSPARRVPDADRLQRAVAATLQPVTAWSWTLSE